MTTRPPVVLIGLDGAEMTLIDKLVNDGGMPALRALRDRGCSGVIQGDGDIFAGGVWPTFYTARPVPWHGIYHNKLWRFENMRCEMASDGWLREAPFWEILNREGLRMAIIDVPMTLGLPKPINGIHINGWGTHDLISKGAWPRDLWKSLRARYGKSLFPAECFGHQNVGTLLKLKKDLLRASHQIIDIAQAVQTQAPWDLFLFVLGAGHRAGHYLWDSSQIDASRTSESQLHEIETAVADIYRELDRGIARIVGSADPGSMFMVFALHGMGRNRGWSDYCPSILSMIMRKESGQPAKSGALYRLKQVLPWPVIRQITRRLPQAVLDKLVQTWSADMFDWSRTAYFPLPMDHAGYIRINLKGREPQGIVDPGDAYDRLGDYLTEALMGWRDTESGQPIVKRIYRLGEIASGEATYRNGLPDIVIVWSDASAIDSKGIRSREFGELPLSGRLPSGRAGNHRPDGWFVASGQGIRPGAKADACRILDLVPSVFSWLNVKAPDDFQGRPIPEICRRP